jgi:hypothetical protein
MRFVYMFVSFIFVLVGCGNAMSFEDRADQLWNMIKPSLQEEICFQLMTFGEFESFGSFTAATHSEEYFIESQEAYVGVTNSIRRNCERDMVYFQ